MDTLKYVLKRLAFMVFVFVIIISVYSLYNLINYTITSFTGNPESVPLGVEPILFGVFCTGFDMLYITVKNVLQNVIRDAKASARRGA